MLDTVLSVLLWTSFLGGIALLLALCLWLGQPIYNAYRSQVTKDHPSEEVFRTSSTSDETGRFSSLLEPASVRLSVIVPAYNEEERIAIMLDEAFEYLEGRCRGDRSFTYEIIVVIDGGKDNTPGVVMRYVDQYGSDKIRMLDLHRNHGKGGAVRKGMMKARGEMLLMADADGATKFHDFQLMEKQLLHDRVNGFAAAIGSRAHMQEEQKANRTVLRSILMQGFHAFVAVLCGGHGIRDTQCGFKLFTRRAAEAVFQSQHIERWAFDVELILICSWLKIPMGEVAVEWQEIDGSKVDVLSDTFQMARDLILIRLCYAVGIWEISPNASGPESS